jgi:pyruvate-formate lyase-activating enzyme
MNNKNSNNNNSNNLKNSNDFKILGFPSKESYNFPNIVNIEVYRSGCYCSCIHCPVGITHPSDRKERFGEESMNIDLYKKIITEIAKYPHSTIRIHSVGEPLMWRNLVEALTFTKNKSVKSWIFSCAATKDIKLLESICDNANVVEISVNSINKQDYIQTKGIDAFELVSGNIQHLSNYIKKNNLSTRLIASRVESEDKLKNKEFIEYWKSSNLLSDAFVRSYHTYNSIIDELPLEKKEHTHEPCLVHWARFNINVKGYAAVCFNEFFKKNLDESLIYGDMKDHTIAELWHGLKLTTLRKAELDRDYSNLTFSENMPCKNCYSCQPLFGNNQTSEHQIKAIHNIKRHK